ncbi:hypothetical protein OpiT1DRAFT_02200 [Opitutaceae bacterium TAV1]|nr:hypothetical protein OpiT1DRAFT_02200 [Opitutaceae bacterium TAV1]
MSIVHRPPLLHPAILATLALFAATITARADPTEVNPDSLPVKTQKPGNVFTLDDTVTFHLPAPAAQTYGWRVRDWQGNLCAEGTLPQGDPVLEIDDLPPGYFELELKGETETRWQPPVPFARIISPDTRVYNPQSPFAADTAQSWLAAKGHRGNKLDPIDPVATLIQLEHLAGLTMIRDRMGWNDQTHPAPGRHDWQPYDTNATQLARAGVQICSLYESYPKRPSPAWTADGIRDLSAIHNFSEAAARQFAGRITAWEFWNEPDLKRDIPAWDFAAAQKAAWIGFKRGSPSTNVLNGSLSNIHRFAGVLDALLDNGIADYHDTFNLHTYLIPRHQHRVLDATRATLARHGQRLSEKPIWITEVGLAYEANGEHAPLQTGSPNREHSPEQARAQAERVITAQVTLHAHGADRVFFFVLPPYNEAGGGKVWGLLRWDWLVKPGYVALANLTAQLSDARLLGSYDAGPGVIAWLFDQNGNAPATHRRDTQTLVLWADVNRTLRHTFAGQQTNLELVDLVGKLAPLSPRTTGSAAGQYAFKIGTAPVFINNLRGLAPATPAHTVLHPPRLPQLPTPAADIDARSTILRPRPGPQFKTIGQLTVSFPETDTADLTVDIFNFSDTPVTGTLKNLGTGYTLTQKNNANATLTIPAMSSVPVPLTIRFASDRRHAAHATLIRIGADITGRNVAPVAIPVLPDFDTTIARAPAHPIASAADPKNWLKNTSGTLDITTTPATANAPTATTFRVKFPANADRWTHPYLKLTDRELAGAIGLTFEIKSAPGSKPTRGILVLTDAATPVKVVNGEQPDTAFDLTDQWQTIKVDFRQNPMFLRPDQVRLLRIGCNPAQPEFEYTIRNLQLHLPPAS